MRLVAHENGNKHALSSSRLADSALVTLCLLFLVEIFASTSFLGGDVVVLAFEATAVLLLVNNFLQEGLLAVLVAKTTAEELSRTFDNGANLRECGNIVLRIVLLIMTFGVQNISHLQKLKITPKLGCEVGLGHIKPFGTSSSLLFLWKLSAYGRRQQS